MQGPLDEATVQLRSCVLPRGRGCQTWESDEPKKETRNNDVTSNLLSWWNPSNRNCLSKKVVLGSQGKDVLVPVAVTGSLERVFTWHLEFWCYFGVHFKAQALGLAGAGRALYSHCGKAGHLLGLTQCGGGGRQG